MKIQSKRGLETVLFFVQHIFQNITCYCLMINTNKVSISKHHMLWFIVLIIFNKINISKHRMLRFMKIFDKANISKRPALLFNMCATRCKIIIALFDPRCKKKSRMYCKPRRLILCWHMEVILCTKKK